MRPYRNCINEFASHNLLAFIGLGTPVSFAGIFIGAYNCSQPPKELLNPTYAILALLALAWIIIGIGLHWGFKILIAISDYIYRCVKYWSLVTAITFTIIIIPLYPLTPYAITYVLVGLIPLFLILVPCTHILMTIRARMAAQRQVPLPESNV